MKRPTLSEARYDVGEALVEYFHWATIAREDKFTDVTINGRTFKVIVIPEENFTEQLADMLGPYEGEGL